MKLYVVVNGAGEVQDLCQKKDNAELRIPLLKRDKKTEQKDRTWKYGYGSDAWSVRRVEVQGERAPGTTTDIVYVKDAENVFFEQSSGGEKFRIRDTNGLVVEELA